MKKTIVGVDIAGSALRAVELADPDKSRPTLLRHHEIPLPPGVVTRGVVADPKVVSAALRQLWSKGGFKSKDVVLGMGNSTVLVRDPVVARAPLDRIREALPFQVQEMLPVPVSEALLDFYPVAETTTEEGHAVKGLLVAAVKESVVANVKAVQMAGLTAVGVDLIPFSLCRTLVTRTGMTGTAAVIDVGAHTTTVIVAADGVPQFVRIIPTGGDDITRAIAERCELDAVAAEAAKRRLGLAREVANLEDQKIVEVVYELVGDLLGSLRNTVNYYANTRQDDGVHRILLAGGGAQLVGFADALATATRIPVEQADPFTAVGLSRTLDSDRLRAERSAITVALGLAVGSAA